MMISEFIALTGFYPTQDLYSAIEVAYYNYPGNKADFCEAYKENRKGLAETIADKVNISHHVADDLTKRKLKGLEADIRNLERKLDKELEWKPYEDKHNTSQADYDRIAADRSTWELSDEEAKELITKEFGFDRDKIQIVHEVVTYEVNRHHQLRKTGTTPRKALFNVWDWNYIVFNVQGNVTMGWEMHNGELKQYWA
ncbi:MAG: hypothetical protein IJ418_02310 [Clostridia bacterium]|nr:hypothetical protein [Clostridia bacterium]